MKRFRFILIAIVGLTTITGCVKEKLGNEDSSVRKVTFNAVLDSDATKTSYQGSGKVDWVEGDLIRYYTKRNGTIDEYEVIRSGHSTNLVADVPEGASYIIAAYGGESLSDNGVTSFKMHGAVKAVQSGKFADAHVSVAKSFDLTDGANLPFRNMTSLFKFTLNRTDVAYVVFTAKGGEKIQGDGELVFSFTDIEPSVAFGEGGGSSIRINTNGSGTFYVSTLPVTLSQGFEMEMFNATDAKIGSIKYDKEFVISSNAIINLGEIDERVEPEPEYVDLGLSVKWAKFNVGAKKPEDCGDYFAWGEIETKDYYDWKKYKWNNDIQTAPLMTKYCTESISGTVDNKTVLELEDDAANVKWGGNWRMPTKEEWSELLEGCSWEPMTINEVNGVKVSGTKTGYTDNWIFLPVAGCIDLDGPARGNGYYWSSTVGYEMYSYTGWSIIFRPTNREMTEFNSRCLGMPVRAVYGEYVKATSISLDETSSSLKEGDVMQLTATLTPSNCLDKFVTWTSSDPAVATVDGTGKVTAVKDGTATITATWAGSDIKATCEVTVLSQMLELSESSINVNGKYQLTATVTPTTVADKTVTWSSSDNNVAMVTATGLVYGISPGECTVTARTQWGGTASCNVTVISSVVDPLEYLVYRNNKVTRSIRDDIYVDCSRVAPPPSGSIWEIKLKYPEGTTSSEIPNFISTNLAKDSFKRLYIGLTYIATSSSSVKYSDISSNISGTGILTLRLAPSGSTINGYSTDFHFYGVSGECMFADYYRERDEGLFESYDGLPDGTRIYYVKVYDSAGRVLYVGHPGMEPSGTKWAWHSISSSGDAYEYASKGMPTGYSYTDYGHGRD